MEETTSTQFSYPPVKIQVERMSKGPAKVVVTLHGDDPDDTASEALRIFRNMVAEIASDPEAYGYE